VKREIQKTERGNDMIPNNFHLLYSKEDIAEQVSRLGKLISQWAQETWEESHTDIIAVPVLRGGIFFFADLVREIETSVEITPVRTWAYEVGQNAVQRDTIGMNLEGLAAKDRKVLLVDDICDSGKTLASLSDTLLSHGATEVRTAALIKRDVESCQFDPNWVGFEYKGPEWFVGYGMEDSERWRNLSDIYIIRS
jgi:hypoxanthine phosphoribosyltransferase